VSFRREDLAEGVTLYLGDCLEVLPTLYGIDAVVSDPPYGIGHRRGKAGDRGKGKTKGSAGIANDSMPFDPSPLLKWPAILWGANHYAQRLPRGRWLLWDKTLGAGSGDFSQFEVAWFSRPGAERIIRHMWMGVQRASEVGEPRLHDTQKPVAVMEWCLEFVPQAHTILDPYMGSGTTGVACIRRSRAFTGIELNDAHFDTACRRIEAALREPRMFPAPKPIKQDSLFDGSEAA